MDEKGFTLIELIVIIVILGILAVTAVPKYIDMQEEAEQGVAEGVAGALAGAAGINYAAAIIGASATTITDCNDLDALLVDSPADYITSGDGGTTLGASMACTVTSPASRTANFTGIAVPAP